MYLTTDEYVARFGEQETILVTDESRTGAIDLGKLEEAIGDAEQTADSYIGKRYITPIAAVPPVVKAWVAALTREALHVNVGQTVEAIERAADRVRSQLRDVANGIMTLPIPIGGVAPGTVSTGDPIVSNDRPCPAFTYGVLADFTAPFNGCDHTPNWRR